MTRELAFKAYRHYIPSAITEVTSNLVQMALKNVKSTEDIDQIDLGMIKTQLEIYKTQGKNKITGIKIMSTAAWCLYEGIYSYP